MTLHEYLTALAGLVAKGMVMVTQNGQPLDAVQCLTIDCNDPSILVTATEAGRNVA